MTTLSGVRQALADVISTAIPALTVYSHLADQIAVPAAMVLPGPGEFLTYQTSETTHDLTLEIRVFVQRGQTRAASEELDSYLEDSGASSIFQVIRQNPTLNGAVDAAWVTGAGSWGSYVFNGIAYLGAILTVEVLL